EGQNRPGGRRRLPAERPRIPRPEQGGDFRERGEILPPLLSPPETDSAHHQDDARGQGRLRAPVARSLRIFQIHGPTTERFGGGEGGGVRGRKFFSAEPRRRRDW